MTLLITNGTVVDPASNTMAEKSIYIEDGVITEITDKTEDKKTKKTKKADQVIDAKGCYVMPGFVDLHVHLRDPGFEYKETVDSGAKAAAKGGFTTIVAMPNTKPTADKPEVISYVHCKAANLAPIRVLQAGAVTKKQAGKELADIEEMVKAGSPAISEDGKSVMDSGLYKEAMKIAARLDIPVLAHCEDINLVKGGVMNRDEKAKELGLPGISNAVEDIIVARDIMLAKETGARLHLCHCSTQASVEMVRAAKEKGQTVTAEVCPHHFTLSTEDIPGDDANYKMNPPLRAKEDVDALIAGLKDGTMDIIATDHAPHSRSEKAGSMKGTAFGIVGLETAAALTYTELVDKKVLTMLQMAEKMSYNPARVLGLDAGQIAVGKPAELVIFDTGREYEIDASQFVSKGKNTPFDGRKVKGEVVTTIFGGKVVYQKQHSINTGKGKGEAET